MKLFNSMMWSIAKAKAKEPEFDAIVSKLMLPYKIDIIMFMVNMDCYINRQGFSYDFKRTCSKSMFYFCEEVQTYDLPLGFPEWFYWAFPDVAYWIIERNGIQTIKSDMPELFSMSDTQMTDPATGRFKYTILKKFVDCFLKNYSSFLELAK